MDAREDPPVFREHTAEGTSKFQLETLFCVGQNLLGLQKLYKLTDTKLVLCTYSLTKMYASREKLYNLKIVINFRLLFFWNLRNTDFCLCAIHLPALINSSIIKTKKCTNVKITFLHTIYHNSNVFRSILVIFTESLNVSICLKMT